MVKEGEGDILTPVTWREAASHVKSLRVLESQRIACVKPWIWSRPWEGDREEGTYVRMCCQGQPLGSGVSRPERGGGEVPWCFQFSLCTGTAGPSSQGQSA